VFTAEGLPDFGEPRALQTDRIAGIARIARIAGIVREYASAARLAVDQAGFEGVEIHAANGYLPHQFLAEGTNFRTDQCGGSAGNRARFPLEVTTGVTAAVGADRVGLRLSPANRFNDIVGHETEDVYAAVVAGVEPLRLAYLQVLEGPPAVTRAIRRGYSGAVIVNAAFSLTGLRDNLEGLLGAGRADLVAVGRAFLAYSDLVHRLQFDAALDPADETSFYGGTDPGYLDYPTLGEAA